MLSRIKLPSADQASQGRRKRLSRDAVRLLDLTKQLGSLGIPAADARGLANALLDHGAAGIASGYVRFLYDPDAHTADLDLRLREAAESVVVPRRGRPSTKRLRT